MLKCYTVGMTHWDNEVTAEDALDQAMLRDRTEFFFAPAHIQKRVRIGATKAITRKLMTSRSKQSKDWIYVREIDGIENFIKTYLELLLHSKKDDDD